MRRAAVILAVLTLASCQRSHKKVIAVVPKATAHIFWESIHAGAQRAGRDLGVDILWNGAASETDYARQIQIVDSMIARKVDGIAIAAADRRALDASLERAAAARIPVTIFDSGVDSERYMTFVATNNHEAGALAARTVARLIGGRGRIIVIQHVPGSRSTMDREQGFDETLAREFPDITVAGRQFGMSDYSKAMAVTENLLTANAGVQAIFASAEPSSLGAALAIKARGLTGKVRFVAFDTSKSLLDDLHAGVIDVLVAQDPFRIGYEAVRTLVDKANGKNPPRRIDLNAVAVTRENFHEPAIQAILFPK